jgi:hypothetical protein
MHFITQTFIKSYYLKCLTSAPGALVNISLKIFIVGLGSKTNKLGRDGT